MSTIFKTQLKHWHGKTIENNIMICIVQISILMFQRRVISSCKDKEIMPFRTCCKLIQKTFLISDKFYIDCYLLKCPLKQNQQSARRQKEFPGLSEIQLLFSC